jgi:spectinomycin phosphotransferase
MRYLQNILSQEYNISAKYITPIQSGWSAQAFKVIADDQKYFLKVYDKNKHTSQIWINRINTYLPLLLILNNNKVLKHSIPNLILSNNGHYRIDDKNNVYIVFDYIDAENLASIPLSKAHIVQLANIVANLHDINDQKIINNLEILETFDTSICDQIMEIIHINDLIDDIKAILIPNLKIIINQINQYRMLAKNLIINKPNYVLCHNDIHRWNILVSDELKLIDWEGISLAPAESDLFSFSDGFFFDNNWDEFIKIYKNLRPGFILDNNALRFYRLRRVLEDINSFSRGLMYDNLNADDRIFSINMLQKSCVLLNLI